MKSTSVRGTPVNSMKAGNREGQMAAKPSGMSGVVNKQYEGDQSGNRQTGLKTGTPYNSKDGNGPETRMVRSQGKYGMVTDKNGDQANHLNTGNGVLFDGVNEAHSLRAGNQVPMHDSPVPSGAQRPVQNGAEVLANLRSGVGAAWGESDGPGNSFREMGGVMTRGMVGTSTSKGSATEMIEDDVLANKGPGGAIG